MSKFLNIAALALALSACAPPAAQQSPSETPPAERPAIAAQGDTSQVINQSSPELGDGPFGLGREATSEEVAAWDIDVKPDGEGLPEGQGTAEQGEGIFSQRCAMCHGDFGEGAGRWPVLAGGQDSLTEARPEKTIGSYWPNLSTVFDYVYRAMPFGHAQSLTPDELYSVVAYLLDLNSLLDDSDMVLSRETFASVVMPNADGFFEDDRPDTPGEQERPPCMSDCKAEVAITMRARVLDVTPDE